MARIPALLCLLAVLAGCGGASDEEDAEQIVRDFVTAVREGDGDTFCEELVTEDFLGEFSGGTGDQAQESCKRELKNLTGLRLKLVRIKGTKVDGDNAAVTAVIDRQGEPFEQVYRLKKQEDDWKLSGAGG